ncbi:MAG: hypothetical protein KGL39_54785 [Patescibacteria group bacterium]|nr:hypothetical protein [Patescibacteria group bacterium]
MSTLATQSSPVKSRVLFDSTIRSQSKPFAPELRTKEARKPYTAADLAWWAENSPANQTEYEVLSRPVHPANRIRPRCPSERLHDGNAEYVDRRAWAIGHDA